MIVVWRQHHHLIARLHQHRHQQGSPAPWLAATLVRLMPHLVHACAHHLLPLAPCIGHSCFKWLGEGAKGILDPRHKGLPRVSCAMGNPVLHRCKPRLHQCKRLLLPRFKRPFAPSPNHFRGFSCFRPLSQALWFAILAAPRAATCSWDWVEAYEHVTFLPLVSDSMNTHTHTARATDADDLCIWPAAEWVILGTLRRATGVSGAVWARNQKKRVWKKSPGACGPGAPKSLEGVPEKSAKSGKSLGNVSSRLFRDSFQRYLTKVISIGLLQKQSL